MAKKQKNFYVRLEFAELLENQSSIRNIPETQLIENDLTELWKAREKLAGLRNWQDHLEVVTKVIFPRNPD